MGIKTPLVTEIAPDTYAINEFGMNAMFLCVGKERALLIDTGTGLCDLKGLVASLTELPYDVVLTHGHVDHAGGMDQFETVYIHEADMQRAKDLTYEERRHYAGSLHSMDKDGAFEVDPGQVRRWQNIPEMKPVSEGDVFDLGGRQLEVFFMPGHTAGSITLLDRKNRIHFSGDACNINTLCLDRPVAELKDTAERIKAMEDLFDQDFNGHLGYAGMPLITSQPKSVRDDVIAACEKALAGEEAEDVVFLGRPAKAMNSGRCRIVYRAESL